MAVWHNAPSIDAVAVWFNDATASADRLKQLLAENVSDQTPDGRIELIQRAVQVPHDITRKTSVSTVTGLLRGLLTDHPNFDRIGVICQRPHFEGVNSIGKEYRHRIAMVRYFGSGDERASNEWHHECDAIVVLGTPRVPTEALATILIQGGDMAAATRNGGPAQGLRALG